MILIRTTKFLSILFATAVVFLFSCGSGNSKQSATIATDTPTVAPAPVPDYDHSFVIGKVTDSIICRNHPTQSYALYLPSYYSSTKQFSCIYFFDSHGLGAMPVRMYKDLAEKYGFVLVGSDFSRNGIPWDVANDGVKVLMNDTRTRINIDPKRIYTSGFSGGSRVAVTVAILDGGVAGVIGCAAGFPKVQYELQNKFDYFGMVGDQDFNLTEMEKWDEDLAQNEFTHQLLTSGGKHGWASPADFGTAMLWIQVAAMKESLQPKNDSLVMAFNNDYNKRIAEAKSSGDWIKAYELLDGMVRLLNGFQDVSSGKQQLASLVADAGYKKAIDLQPKLQQQELEQQQEFIKQYPQQNEQWLTAKVAELAANGHNANTQIAQMNLRLLNYFGFISYATANNALMSGDLANAAIYIKVFKMADPKNPDGSYLSALYYMKTGNREQAILSLNASASLGFNDVAQLMADDAFRTMHNDAGFIKMVNKVMENCTSK